MNNPFRCGPNPCEWYCGPAAPACNVCSTTSRFTHVDLTLTNATLGCQNCAELDARYVMEWGGSSTPEDCIWYSTPFIWSCDHFSTGPTDWEINTWLGFFDNSSPIGVLIRFTFQFRNLGGGNDIISSYALIVEDVDQLIDCTAEYTLPSEILDNFLCVFPATVTINAP